MKKQRFRYPSVTEILEPYVDFSMVKPEVLARAKARGTIVHQLTKGLITYGVAVNIPEKYKGYVDSFLQWYHDSVSSVLISEKRIYNEALRLCGQPDLVVVLKNEQVPRVIDIKTPAGKYPTWKGQICAYKFLYDQEYGELTDMPGHLRLRENGKYPILTLLEPDIYKKELEMFFKAHTCFHHYV